MKNNKWIVFVGIGVEAIAIILGAVWLGQWLDKSLVLPNTFATIFPLLGLSGWIYHILVMVKKMNEDGK